MHVDDAVIFGGSSAKMERTRTDCGTCIGCWELMAFSEIVEIHRFYCSIIVGLEVFACLCQVSNDKISIILLLRHL